MSWCYYPPGADTLFAVGLSGVYLSPSVVTVPPPVEPVTVEQAKQWRTVTHSLQDDLFAALITTAREYVEGYCGVSLVTQTRQISVAAYTEGMPLPFGPVQSVTAPAESAAPYLVEYVAGYPAVAGSDPVDYIGNIPQSFMLAMRLLIGNWDFNREATITGASSTPLELGVRMLLDNYRQRLGTA